MQLHCGVSCGWVYRVCFVVCCVHHCNDVAGFHLGVWGFLGGLQAENLRRKTALVVVMSRTPLLSVLAHSSNTESTGRLH